MEASVFTEGERSGEVCVREGERERALEKIRRNKRKKEVDDMDCARSDPSIHHLESIPIFVECVASS